MHAKLMLYTAATLALQLVSSGAQSVLSVQKSPQSALVASGQIVISGHATPYLIRHLPVSSFPALPRVIADELNKRGCTIPQTYEAHRPENVIHANFEGRGSTDWAVLCAAQGTISLLVFFNGGAQPPAVLASTPETERLQAHDPSGVLGFNWGIDSALPEQITDAQSGMKPRPPILDHDAIADVIVEHKTVYHFYSKGTWTLLKLPD